MRNTWEATEKRFHHRGAEVTTSVLPLYLGTNFKREPAKLTTKVSLLILLWESYSKTWVHCHCKQLKEECQLSRAPNSNAFRLLPMCAVETRERRRRRRNTLAVSSMRRKWNNIRQKVVDCGGRRRRHFPSLRHFVANRSCRDANKGPTSVEICGGYLRSLGK